MRRAVRAIVIRDGHLLVMHRNKFGLEYYTLVGGGIDVGETPEQALVRELREETGMAISQPRLTVIEDAGNEFGMQYIYLCEYKSGEPKLDANSEEAHINAKGKNTYEPLWLPLTELANIPFRSEQLKQVLLQSLKTGFGPEPIHIQSA